VDERAYYSESPAKKPATLNCPHCRTQETYELNYLVRTKKDRLPGGADERDRAKFAKAQSYMVRRDDKLGCANIRCRKPFEITSLQSLAFIQD
jgi:hypothetical protein